MRQEWHCQVWVWPWTSPLCIPWSIATASMEWRYNNMELGGHGEEFPHQLLRLKERRGIWSLSQPSFLSLVLPGPPRGRLGSEPSLPPDCSVGLGSKCSETREELTHIYGVAIPIGQACPSSGSNISHDGWRLAIGVGWRENKEVEFMPQQGKSNS